MNTILKTPLVSIIIPTYNRAHLIGETLDSIIAQTYTNWECIVVDDGSTDSTDELMAGYCKKDARFQYHHRPKDRLKGGNAARNYGFELSKGEYIQWFDSDDLMLRDNIKDKTNYFKIDVKVVIGTGQIVNKKSEYIRDLHFFQNQNAKDTFKSYILKKMEIYTPSVMFKKKYLNSKSLFNENILRSQEVDFFSRILFTLKNSELLLIDNKGFLYRQHNDNKTTKDQVYNASYKMSHFLVHFENLKKAFSLGDIQIENYCKNKIYKVVIEMIRNDDRKNYKNIITQLKGIISIVEYYKLLFTTKLLWFTKGRGYKLKSIIIKEI